MSSATNDIHAIIVRFLTDQLSATEASELEQWKLASRDNLQEYNDFIAIWAKSNSLRMPQSVNFLKAQKSIRKNAGINSSNKRWINLAVQAAAVLVLSLLFSGIYSYLSQENRSRVSGNQFSVPIYQEIKAAYGTQAKVELADGTTVFLNSGSKLRFPQTFNNLEQRKVILDGEGYFKVKKNKNQPFIVQTSQVNVRVLGTTFNVDAYADNQFVNVALVEGSVSLQEDLGNKSKDLMQLSHNQVAILNMTDHTLSKVDETDLYKYTAWINGRLVFYGDPIQTVVKKLEKWYNVKVIISDKRLDNYKFTGTFIDDSLEGILKILSMTSPMTYVMKPIVKQADGSMSKRIIILKSRSLN